jgi:creatinine amidohydrolase
MTTRDLAEAGPDVGRWIAVLPVAAIEQHGPHLPLATDAAIAEGLIATAIGLLPEALPVTFLPVQAVGKSDEHIGFPGTLTAGHETAARLWLDIGDSVARAGVRKLILITSHGGNVPVVDIVTRELRIRHRMLAVGTSWARFGLPDGLFGAPERAQGIHGGDVETSLMLHFRPELVRMDLARDFASAQASLAGDFTHLRAHGPVQFGWQAEDLNPAGAVGNASAATSGKGRAVAEHQARAFAALCADVDRFDPGRLGRSGV